MLKNSTIGRPQKNHSSSNVFEPLEGRTFFDLVPTIAAEVPASLIATVKTNDAVFVDLTNTGSTTIKGPYTLELFASSDGSLADATPIVILYSNLAPLAAGKTRAVRVPLGAFPLVANANYNILAQITGSLAGTGDNLAVSGSQVAVTDPFVDLSDTFTYVGPAFVKPGQTIVDVVSVTNNGNVPARGPLVIDLSATNNSDGSDAVQFASVTVLLNAVPGKTQSFRFPFSIPTTTAPGVYYGVATVDPSNTFNDPNTANNTTVSQTGLNIVSLYPNIVGTFSGPYEFVSGQDKGTTGTLNIVITAEDPTTGELTGAGTSSNGANFTFTGTITPQGAVSLTTGPSGGNSTLTAHFADGTLIGTIDLTIKDSDGKFTLTL